MRTQNIHFVTGKGGVGKSSFALTLATYLAQQGKKVLLAELGSHSFYQDFLQIKIEYQPTQYKPNIDICLWSGKECLKEYAMHLLKFEPVYNLFFENKLSRSLIDIAPSLAEISILGKITSGLRKVGPPLNYDSIVVDAYATGHMMALLKAPRGLMEAIPFGPMGEQTRSILEIIRNKKNCKYWIVSLPEDLPVTETIELYNSISEEVKINPQIILNKILPVDEIESLNEKSHDNQGEHNEKLTLSSKELQFIKALQIKIQKEKNLKAQLKNLVQNNEVFVIPFIFESDPATMIKNMQEQFSLEIKKQNNESQLV